MCVSVFLYLLTSFNVLLFLFPFVWDSALNKLKLELWVMSKNRRQTNFPEDCEWLTNVGFPRLHGWGIVWQNALWLSVGIFVTLCGPSQQPDLQQQIYSNQWCFTGCYWVMFLSSWLFITFFSLSGRRPIWLLSQCITHLWLVKQSAFKGANMLSLY